MSDSKNKVIYRSAVSIKAERGRAKLVTVPIDGGPVTMGVNKEIAGHYRIPEGTYTPHAATLDYLVGATAACLTGTFGGTLEAIGQPINDGQLTSKGEADIELDGSVMVVRVISVHYRVKLAEGVSEDKVVEAHETHAGRCPIARSIGSCIAIQTDLTVE